MASLRVLVADDHALIREGTRQILANQPDFEVIGEAEDGQQTLDLITRDRPELALVDLRLPDFSGIEVARAVKSKDLPTKVVILSAFDDQEYIAEALNAGAAGYLSKTLPSSELIDGLRQTVRGEPSSPGKSNLAPKPSLSRREGEVLRLLTEGLSNKQIARRLFVSIRTVEGHIAHIFDKLGVGSRTEAVLYALKFR